MIYDIAGLRIHMQNRSKFTDKFCKEYLSANQTSPVDIVATATDEELLAEKKLNPENFSDGYVENICLYRSICRQIPKFNRILLHSAVIKYNDDAYAFLGRSGAGKSTHTGLWSAYLPNVTVINGDKPILEERKGHFFAYGTPWMGKERLGTNTFARLKGICFIEQSKENKIIKLTPSQTASKIFSQVLIPGDEENANKTLEILDKLVVNVPAYLLCCDISAEAVRLSFEALTGEIFPIKNNEGDIV